MTQISRGSVRIEKNPALCFVTTIDWSLITLNSGATENIFKLNKPQNECPTCLSANENGNAGTKNSTELPSCPESMETKQRLCWNRQLCQHGKFGKFFCEKKSENKFFGIFKLIFFLYSLPVQMWKSYM